MTIAGGHRGRRITALAGCVLLAVPAMALPSLGGVGRAATGAFPGAAGDAGHRPATSASSPIRHVVVLYLENHSFDNLLGFWCNAHPGRCPDGGMPASVRLSNGAVVTPGTDPDVVPIVQHNAKDQTHAMDGGKMDGWQRIPGCGPTKYHCITGYKPSQEPNLTSLATQFAISDKFFSLANSPSWGGHLDIVTSNLDGFVGDEPHSVPGVTYGQGWGCDSNKTTGWSATPGGTVQKVPSCIPDPALPLPNGGAFEPTPVSYEPTIMDRLSGAGLSWKLYTTSCPKEVTASNGLMTCDKQDHKRGYFFSICPSIAECLYTQHHTAPTEQFLRDAAKGRLPAFSVVIPSGNETSASEHNGFSMTTGDNFIGQVANAIMTGRQWHSTALFITWDDCGCFYDQVPPPVNPDGTQEGPRLPLVIASPYAKPAYTDTTDASLASILAYTEHNFALAPLGINDRQAYDLSGAFNYEQAPLKPVPMVTRQVPRRDHIKWAQANEAT